MLCFLSFGLLLASVLPPENPGKTTSGTSVAEAIAAIQRAYQRQHCDPAELRDESDAALNEKKSFPFRVWLDGSRFFAEIKDRSFWVPLLYEWGCITKEGEATFLSRAGLGEKFRGDEDLKRRLLGERYGLLQREPDYVGALVLGECGDGFADACPERSQIIEGVLDVVRSFLTDDPQEQQLLDAGRIVVTIGEFSCFSESVWVLVEPTERPAWEIKLQRGETCEDMSIIPKEFRLLGDWPVPLSPEEQAMDNPVTPELVERIRAHGVVVRLAPKPKGK
jgi:hypothetical protein